MIDLPPAGSSVDLETLIQRAEMNVIEGDQKLRLQASRLLSTASKDAKRAAMSGAAGLTGAGAALLIGWMIFRARRKKSARRRELARDNAVAAERIERFTRGALPLTVPELASRRLDRHRGSRTGLLQSVVAKTSTVLWWLRLLRRIRRERANLAQARRQAHTSTPPELTVGK